jgi:hypothetical protein
MNSWPARLHGGFPGDFWKHVGISKQGNIKEPGSSHRNRVSSREMAGRDKDAAVWKQGDDIDADCHPALSHGGEVSGFSAKPQSAHG